MADRWPWPKDTQLERSRRVAGAYRRALADLNPARCAEVDARVIEMGQRWAVPLELTEEAVEHLEHAELSAVDMALLTGIPETTIRAWASKGQLPKVMRDGKPMYLAADVWKCQAQRRKTRPRRTGQ